MLEGDPDIRLNLLHMNKTCRHAPTACRGTGRGYIFGFRGCGQLAGWRLRVRFSSQVQIQVL